MIWGMILNPGEDWTIEAHSEEHLTMASLECRPGQNNGETDPCSYLILKLPSREHVICTLQKGLVLQQSLDMVIQSGSVVTFTVQGTGTVYLTGYNRKPVQATEENTTSEMETSAEREEEGDGSERSEENEDQRDDIEEADEQAEKQIGPSTPQSSPSRTNLRYSKRVRKDSGSPEIISDEDGDKENEHGRRENPTPSKRMKVCESRDQDENPGNGATDEEGALFRCEDCWRTYKFKGTLKTHMKKVHNKDMDEKSSGCSICGKMVKESSRERHERSHSNTQCKICKKDFVSSWTLRRHMKTHEVQPMDFKCSHCPKVFSTLLQLDRHKRDCHCMVKRFQCWSCRKAYWTRQELDLHMQCHSASLSPTCPFCMQTFQDQVKLKAHMKSHEAEKPFKCQSCGTRYENCKKLHDHQVEHADTVERPYHCGFCEKSYKYKPDVVYHEHSHLGGKTYDCSICGRAFFKKSKKELHEKTHKSDGDLPCSICGRRFRYLMRLKHHEASHKALQCKECGFYSINQDSLADHMNVMHNGILQKETKVDKHKSPNTKDKPKSAR